MKALPYQNYAITAFVSAVLASGGTYYVAANDTEYRIVENTPSSVPYQYATESVRVASVTDGDTFVLTDGRRVRLIGINAPEYSACGGSTARDELARLVSGKSVRIEKDLRGTDDFGRYLRYVYLDDPDPASNNILINQHLLKQGFAYQSNIGQDKRYRAYFAAARLDAERNGRGIWSACERPKATSTRPDIDAKPTDPNCLLKGNISNEGRGKTYIPPSCSIYKNTKIDPSIGEQYFCDEASAIEAGFSKSGSCK